MKHYAERRKLKNPIAPRRRAHDVVIWQEQCDQFEDREWVVYDSVLDLIQRFDDELAAIAFFKNTKARHSEAKLV